MLLNDKSPRTRAIMIPLAICASALIMSAGSLAYVPFGVKEYNVDKAQSSSPIGSNAEFTITNAGFTIKGLYTDSLENVLIVRLGTEGDSAKLLPASGLDYNVLISSDKIPSHVEKMDILFGRMSTDGDLFLVIPKPNKGVYNVFIENTKNIVDVDEVGNVGNVDGFNYDKEGKSLGGVLSQYDYYENQTNTIDDNSRLATINEAFDFTQFRVTLNPSFETEAFKIKRLPGSLLSDNGEFQFKHFFDTLFKDSSLRDLNLLREDIDRRIESMDGTIEEYRSRVAKNGQDLEAQELLDEALYVRDNLIARKDEVTAKINSYAKLQYNPALFSELQTSATVV